MSAIAARRARLAAAQSPSSSPSQSTESQYAVHSNNGKRPIHHVAAAEVSPSDGPDARHAAIQVSGEPTRSLQKRRKATADERHYVGPATSSRNGTRTRSSPASDVEDEEAESRSKQQTGTHGRENTPPLTAHSTFVPTMKGAEKNVILEATSQSGNGKAKAGTQKIVCTLKMGETLCITGSGSVTVMDGAIAIGGATLTVKHCDALIFAPNNLPLPVIEAVGEVQKDRWAAQYGIDNAKYAAIICLTADTASNLDQIHRLCPSISRDAFTTSASAPTSWPLTGFATAVNSSKGTLRAYIPPTWSQALQELEDNCDGASPLICLVRGTKRTGKSTLCRHALQRLLTVRKGPLAYLETDVGQSEFGLAGTVALHLFDSTWREDPTSSPLVFGPSWSSIRHPVRSHFLGDFSPKNTPSAYVTGIADLMTTYRRDWQPLRVPLIVNTQGWVKGLGASLLAQIEELVMPTHILDVSDDANIASTALPLVTSTVGQAKVVPVEAAPAVLTRERGPNAVEARMLNLLSYFYSTQLPSTRTLPASASARAKGAERDSCACEPRWDFSHALIEQRPFVVDVETGVLGGIHVQGQVSAVPEHLQLLALNGSCVAMVLSIGDGPEKTEGQPPSPESTWSSALRKPLPDVHTSTCLGLAIVRSIDPEKAQVHLVAPLSHSVIRAATDNLQQKNGNGHSARLSLIKGAVDVPLWLSLDAIAINASRSGTSMSSVDPADLAGVPLAQVPYLDFDVEADEAIIGMKKRRVRRNLLRPSQRGSQIH